MTELDPGPVAPPTVYEALGPAATKALLDAVRAYVNAVDARAALPLQPDWTHDQAVAAYAAVTAAQQWLLDLVYGA
jgi:hypothetical protein